MSGLVKICLVLMVTFFVIGSAVIGIVRLTGHDPFDSDSRALPQPISTLKNYSCLLTLSEIGDSASVFCEFTSQQGSSEDIPITTVVIQSDNLRLGDLLMCLGMPTDVQHISFVHGENMVNLLWNTPTFGSLMNLNNEQLDYFLPLSYLSMESKGSLCHLV